MEDDQDPNKISADAEDDLPDDIDDIEFIDLDDVGDDEGLDDLDIDDLDDLSWEEDEAPVETVEAVEIPEPPETSDPVKEQSPQEPAAPPPPPSLEEAAQDAPDIQDVEDVVETSEVLEESETIEDVAIEDSDVSFDDDLEPAPPPKKKSGFKMVVTLLLLIALGGGGWLYIQIEGLPSFDKPTRTAANTGPTPPSPMPSLPNERVSQNEVAEDGWDKDEPIGNVPTEATVVDPVSGADPSLPMPAPVLSLIEEQDAAMPAEDGVLTPLPDEEGEDGRTDLLAELPETDKAMVAEKEDEAQSILKPAVQVTPIDDIIADGSFTPQEKGEVEIESLEKLEAPEMLSPPELPVIAQTEQGPAPEPEEELLIEQTPVLRTTAQAPSIRDEDLDEIHGQIDQLETQLSKTNAELVKKIASTEKTVGDLSASLGRLEKSLETIIEMQKQTQAQAIKQVSVTKTEKPAAKQAVKPAILAKKPTPKPAAKTPKTPAKPTASSVWLLRSAQPGQALISEKGSNDYLSIRTGDKVPGIGDVISIALEQGKWTVKGTKGNIHQ